MLYQGEEGKTSSVGTPLPLMGAWLLGTLFGGDLKAPMTARVHKRCNGHGARTRQVHQGHITWWWYQGCKVCMALDLKIGCIDTHDAYVISTRGAWNGRKSWEP